MTWFALGFLPLLFWIAALLHLLRTKEYALSSKSQLGWLGLVLLFPFLGAVGYWGFEMIKRRQRMNRPPPGYA